MIKRAERLNRMQLVVGIPSDGKPRKSSEEDTSTDITNAELGVIHEFGVPEKGIPERSFMRSTASEETDNLGRLAKIQIAECLKGEISTHDAFATVGAYLQGKIVEKITDGEFQPNTPETLKRKLTPVKNKKKKRAKDADKPLIDTGQLRASITYEVREK
ncbi:hypothetical protein J3T98_02690 [Gilliamella sp. B2772]|uniref:hypothetical protein n=1 Tax=Gilliamella sp. B2772 TaxID=2817981 RepID=UPI00226A9645|nr:hypothetical protein [Gilliamella sp. B2772]MCX8659862.1 hypothetical protein [Gilliamella sp. B2772]